MRCCLRFSNARSDSLDSSKSSACLHTPAHLDHLWHLCCPVKWMKIVIHDLTVRLWLWICLATKTNTCFQTSVNRADQYLERPVRRTVCWLQSLCNTHVPNWILHNAKQYILSLSCYFPFLLLRFYILPVGANSNGLFHKCRVCLMGTDSRKLIYQLKKNSSEC